MNFTQALVLGLAAGGILGVVPGGWAANLDPAGSEAAGIVSGIQRDSSPALLLNPKTGRLEARDAFGSLLEEFPPGSTGKVFDFSNQEYRLSFGRDDEGRLSVLVRPGPAMTKPVILRVFGRKVVMSPEASLVATVGKDELTYFEPSICGQVYYVEPDLVMGGEVSRRATAMRESAILAKPSSPLLDQPGQIDPASKYNQDVKSAGQAVKSAFLTLFGLPDKQPTQKARVYKLRSSSEMAPDTTSQPSPATAGRP